nr:hypothetical protein [Brucella intermedia]
MVIARPVSMIGVAASTTLPIWRMLPNGPRKKVLRIAAGLSCISASGTSSTAMMTPITSTVRKNGMR